MPRSLGRLAVGLLLLLVLGSPAFAQGGGSRSSLSGTVVDTGGGVIPGASVTVKNNATGVGLDTVTNRDGAFSVPSLDAGTYTVTVALTGFKTVVIKDVILQAATPANLKATLEVGNMATTIEVKGGTELIQTQTANISTTLNVDQIAKLPASTRNALNFITFLPGVETTTTNRGSTVMGLPQSTISITIDGVNVQDNYLKTTDGFFARVTPRQDAVEQVTVSTATPGADAAGQGAVQIQFVTRSGTNQYKGTAYEFHRDPSLNTNYWFNEKNGLPKNHVVLNQFGFSEGGPIVIPGLIDGRGKAFFFFNHEEFHQPTEATDTRTVMNPLTQSGIFQYTSGGTTRQVDLLALASASGQLATMDPTVKALLAQIAASTQGQGALTQNTDPNTMRYIFQNPGQQVEHQPTVRVDFNLGHGQRLTGTYNWEKVVRDPDILNGAESRFPGFPSFRNFTSYRPASTVSLRSTLSANLVNEIKFGGTWGPSYFGDNETPDLFQNQGGFSLGVNAFAGITTATTETAPSSRSAANWNLDDTLTWLRGKHNLTLGGDFTQVRTWVNNQTLVPSISFGLDTNDPANGFFTAANFPGASTTNLNDAKALYAVLTGRVTQISGTSRLDENTNEYTYLGPAIQRGLLNEVGVYGQDSWRVSPTVTLNAGLRWEVELPFSPMNDIFSTATLADICGVSGQGPGPNGRNCNLFQPGVLTGIHPAYVQYNAGQPGYHTDWNNVAPNVSVAWRPNVQHGWLRTILGDPDQATIRGGYSVAYNRNGTSDFIGVYGANPGSSITATRNVNNGNLLLSGQTFPLLLRDGSSLGPPPLCGSTITAACTPVAPNYPLPATGSINIFDPALQLSFSRSYTIGIQRSLSRDMALEVRYVGTRNVNGWTTEDWNEQNIFESGFLSEFKLAQANLAANVAAGRGGTFAYFGPGSGTSPLPLYVAAFNGIAAAQAGDASKYTGTNWTNSTFVGRLSYYNPQPFSALNDLWGNAGRRTSLLSTGIPVNLFVLNPDINSSSANITRSESFTKYDSLQLDLRRRFSRGLQTDVNLTYAVRYGSVNESIHIARYLLESAGVPWALKANFNYELPIGRGRRFGANLNKWVNGAVGGWEFDGTARVQQRQLAMSGVRLVGMSASDLQGMYKIRIAADKTVTVLPDDVILNTRRAFNLDPTSPTGYSAALGVPTGQYIAPASTPDCVELFLGDCGEPKQFLITTPVFARIDLSVRKTFALKGRSNFQLQFDLLNAFNAINFNPVLNPGSGATIFQVTSAYTDLSNTFDPGGRLGQFSFRLNW
jgi:hypothetical protein